MDEIDQLKASLEQGHSTSSSRIDKLEKDLAACEHSLQAERSGRADEEARLKGELSACAGKLSKSEAECIACEAALESSKDAADNAVQQLRTEMDGLKAEHAAAEDALKSELALLASQMRCGEEEAVRNPAGTDRRRCCKNREAGSHGQR